MLRYLLSVGTFLGILGTAMALPPASYDAPTVFVVRVGTTTSSVNVGGANVVGGVNIVPFQNASGWTAGAAMSASPTDSTTALTISPTATSEGALTLNGTYLGLAGYRTGGNSSGTDRVVVQVPIALGGGINGGFSTAPTMDTTTAFPNAEGYTANNIRGVVWSSDGTQYWTSGTATSTGGVRTDTFGTTSGSTQVSSVPANVRTVNIFNGQLYSGSSTASGGNFRGVNTVGTGLPTATGTTTTSLIDQSGSSSYGFAISPDSLTVYVADDRTSAAGGIQKWTRGDTSSSFTLATTFGTGVTNVGARGLAVDFTTANPTIYAATGETTSNRLITFSDVGGVQTDLPRSPPRVRTTSFAASLSRRSRSRHCCSSLAEWL